MMCSAGPTSRWDLSELGNGLADGGGFVDFDLVALIFVFPFRDVLEIELVNGFGFEIESEVAMAEQDDDLGFAFIVGVDVPGDGHVTFDIELGGLVLFPSDFSTGAAAWWGAQRAAE